MTTKLSLSETDRRWRPVPAEGTAMAGGLGTQDPCGRGAALLDQLPDDGREILMARRNLCYLKP